MTLFNGPGHHAVRCLLAASLSASLVAVPASADVWVLEPSISLDQRFDDNYYLNYEGDGLFSATRVVGELGLSRESQAASYRGIARVDGLLTTANDNGEEGLDSNQLLAFDANLRSARSRYGVLASYKQDTPSRDIAADLSDPDNLASDTNLDLSTKNEVARQKIILEPNYEYDLSRRLVVDSQYTLTLVEHGLPSPQRAIYDQYLLKCRSNPDLPECNPIQAFDEVTIEEAGKPFVATGELDDYMENEVDLGLRFKYSPITTLTATASYSHFKADVEPQPEASFTYTQLLENADPDNRDILRTPRRESISTTATLKLGFERSLTPTLRLTVDGGIYTNTTDATDTLRPEDYVGRENDPFVLEKLATLESSTNGWLTSVTLNYDAGQTRYRVRFAVDVQPSSAGSQVETNELIGDLYRTISPRMNFSLRGRAYEPDRLGVKVDDEYARRFISVEPKIEWKASRDWTVSGSYRYRRQKAQTEPLPAESHAILLALKYTFPSEVRDAAKASGL